MGQVQVGEATRFLGPAFRFQLLRGACDEWARPLTASLIGAFRLPCFEREPQWRRVTIPSSSAMTGSLFNLWPIRNALRSSGDRVHTFPALGHELVRRPDAPEREFSCDL